MQEIGCLEQSNYIREYLTGGSNITTLLFAAITAFVISFVLMPFVIKLAHHVKAIDVPKDDRRVHKKPTPLIGGLGIFVSFMIATLMFVDLPTTKLLSIIAGAQLMVFIGFIDDINPVSPKAKFLVQILAAVITVYGGVRITLFTPFFLSGASITFNSVFSFIITVIWIVGITNTINFIDGLDGLSGGISSISAFTISYICFANDRMQIAVLAVILASACLGFLPYNFNPARIFIGDTGALFVGFMLAVISVEGTIKGAVTLAIISPLLVLGLPVFDMAFAIIRRLLKKQPPWVADKGHIHHRILDLGFGQKSTVLLLYFISIMFGLTVIFILNYNYIGAVITFVIGFSLIIFPVRKSIRNQRRKEQSHNS